MIECGEHIGGGDELRSAPPVGRKTAIEHVPGRKPNHLDEPVDDLPLAPERQSVVRRDRRRQEAEVAGTDEAPIEAECGPGISLTRFEKPQI
jgi:hypothetical protein